MPYEQAKEILKYAREFHHQVSKFYQQVADKGQSERVKLLLDYMIRHEKHLEKAMKDYEKSISSKALEAWHQYSSEQRTFAPLEHIEYGSNMSVDEIMRIATAIDNCLVASYKGMAETTNVPVAREIFANLLEMEEQQKHVKARAALGINDM